MKSLRTAAPLAWSIVRSLFVTSVVWLGLGGCSGSQSSAGESRTGSDRLAPRLEGRIDRASVQGPRLGWPGTSIEARFSGPRICVELVDTPIEDDTRETDWIDVAIDGSPPMAYALSEGRKTYCFAAPKEAGAHTIKITKRTEGEVGEITFLVFHVAPKHRLLPLGPPPPMHIEFIGDSITAGYGAEGSSGACHWSAATENASRTYAAVAARELGASFSLIAWSGKGLLRNYDPSDRQTLPAVYERTLPTRPESIAGRGEPRADVVVINLGTNDWFSGVPDRDAWTAEFLRLLEAVRRRHPGARIVLALGPMLADDFPQPNARREMRAWLTAIARREQVNPLDLIEFWTDPAEGVGCDVHPNVRTHARLGHELAALLQRQPR